MNDPAFRCPLCLSGRLSGHEWVNLGCVFTCLQCNRKTALGDVLRKDDEPGGKWSEETLQMAAKLQVIHEKHDATKIKAAPDGKMIAVPADGTVICWIEDGEKITQIKTPLAGSSPIVASRLEMRSDNGSSLSGSDLEAEKIKAVAPSFIWRGRLVKLEDGNYMLSRKGNHEDWDFAATDKEAAVAGNVGCPVLEILQIDDTMLLLGGANGIDYILNAWEDHDVARIYAIDAQQSEYCRGKAITNLEYTLPKPPLGVYPRVLWEETHPEPTAKDLCDRIRDIQEAHRRFVGTDFPVPATLAVEFGLRNSQYARANREEVAKELAIDARSSSRLQAMYEKARQMGNTVSVATYFKQVYDLIKSGEESFPVQCPGCEAMMKGIYSTCNCHEDQSNDGPSEGDAMMEFFKNG